MLYLLLVCTGAHQLYTNNHCSQQVSQEAVRKAENLETGTSDLLNDLSFIYLHLINQFSLFYMPTFVCTWMTEIHLKNKAFFFFSLLLLLSLLHPVKILSVI